MLSWLTQHCHSTARARADGWNAHSNEWRSRAYKGYNFISSVVQIPNTTRWVLYFSIIPTCYYNIYIIMSVRTRTVSRTKRNNVRRSEIVRNRQIPQSRYFYFYISKRIIFAWFFDKKPRYEYNAVVVVCVCFFTPVCSEARSI